MTDKSDNSDLNIIGNDLRTLILERVSSPLIFSFLVSWLLINSKIFIVIFSSLDVHEKLKYLDNYFSGWHQLLYTILYPAVSTIIYVFFPYPQINSRTQRVVSQYKVKLNDDQKTIWGKALVSVEDLEHIRASHGRKVTRLTKEIDDLKMREKELEAQLSEVSSILLNAKSVSLESKERSEPDEDNSDSSDPWSLSETQRDVLIFIASIFEKDQKMVPRDFILRNLNKDKLTTLSAINYLRDNGLIYYNSNHDSYILTDSGIEAVLHVR